MAAPTTHSARSPEAEGSNLGLAEPSMEDILASIRRIIAEDQTNNLGRSGLGGLTRRAPAAATAPAVQTADDPATLVPPVAEPLAQAVDEPALHAGPQADTLAHVYEAPGVETASHPVEIADAAPSAVSDTRHPGPEPATYAEAHRHDATQAAWEPGTQMSAVASDETEPLMSAAAGASITSSFQSLAESMVLEDPDLIERVMRDAMRPLLKAWLDDHLPSIVERLVRTEIERVARGGRARTAQ